MRIRRIAPAVVAGVAVVALTPLLPASAASNNEVRKSDFISGYSDTRSAGAYGFGPKGLVIETKGSADTEPDGKGGTQNADKVAEYFKPVSTALPASGSYNWSGTDLYHRPGSQIVFHRAGQTDYNVLVGEDIYTVGPNGDPSANPDLTDWWYTGGKTKADQKGIVCPQTSIGSGSNCHGTLAEWNKAVPGAGVDAVGFSLGSGIQGSGALSSITFDSDVYAFVDTPGSVTSNPQAPTPTALNRYDEVGSAVVTQGKRKIRFALNAEALPSGTFQGNGVSWKVVVGKRTRLDVSQVAGQSAGYAYRNRSKKSKVVRLYKNGALAGKYRVLGR